MSLRAGDPFGPYILVDALGRGASGEVWSAVHSETGEDRALKVLHRHHADVARTRLRFVREAVAANSVKHPNVVQVYDVGERDDRIYIVFEWLRGESLDRVLRADPTMPTRTFLELMRQVADALAETHDAQIVHRDVKPANVFVHRSLGSSSLAAKLLDFGVSKVMRATDGMHTQTGSFLGSPRYASPEHVLAPASVDARSDIWALGVVVFEGLTGTYPHDARDVVSLVRAISSEPPASIDTLRPSLPVELRSLVRDCLRPKRTRLASARDLARRLGAILESGSPALDEALPPHTTTVQALANQDVTEAIVPETVGCVSELWKTRP